AAYTAHMATPAGIALAQVQALAGELRLAGRGVIVVGPSEDQALVNSVIALAEQLHYPIIADPLSQLRSGEHSKQHIIDSYDSFLRIDAVAEQLQPKLFLRFGAMPVSKPLMLYMNKYPEAKHIVVDEAGWRDPTLLV